jgi:hypothetical protein
MGKAVGQTHPVLIPQHRWEGGAGHTRTLNMHSRLLSVVMKVMADHIVS